MTARSDDCVRSIPAFCRRGGLSAPPFSPSAADQVVKGLIEIIARPYTALRCEDLSVFFHTHLNPPLSWISLYDIAELTNDFFERFSLRNTKMYPRFIPAEVRCDLPLLRGFPDSAARLRRSDTFLPGKKFLLPLPPATGKHRFLQSRMPEFSADRPL